MVEERGQHVWDHEGFVEPDETLEPAVISGRHA